MVMRVLLVDDDEDNLRRLVADQPYGMQFVVVRDTFTAIYLLYEFDLEQAIEIVICNLQLRNGDVIEMIEQLKSDPKRHIPFLLFTCAGGGAELRRSSSGNVVALRPERCITMKTFDPELLCKEVKMLLDR